MKYFEDVVTAWRHADECIGYRSAVVDFSDGPTPWDGDDFRSLRRINSNAYFALLFAQFEDEVNRICGNLIREQKAGVEWKSRRSWEIIDESRLRSLKFMTRVALLFEKGGSAYNRIEGFYKKRNAIAHGKIVGGDVDVYEYDNSDEFVNVDEFVRELRELAELMNGRS